MEGLLLEVRGIRRAFALEPRRGFRHRVGEIGRVGHGVDEVAELLAGLVIGGGKAALSLRAQYSCSASSRGRSSSRVWVVRSSQVNRWNRAIRCAALSPSSMLLAANWCRARGGFPFRGTGCRALRGLPRLPDVRASVLVDGAKVAAATRWAGSLARDVGVVVERGGVRAGVRQRGLALLQTGAAGFRDGVERVPGAVRGDLVRVRGRQRPAASVVTR